MILNRIYRYEKSLFFVASSHLVEVVCGLPAQILELSVALKHPGGEGARLRVVRNCKREDKYTYISDIHKH